MERQGRGKRGVFFSTKPRREEIKVPRAAHVGEHVGGKSGPGMAGSRAPDVVAARRTLAGICSVGVGLGPLIPAARY
jgi:hypothetical protein